MADLNLVPNPSIIAIQLGVFLTAIAIIKKLFVAPYLALRDAQAKLTSGRIDDAKSLQDQNSQMSQNIDGQISAAIQKTRVSVETSRTDALARKQEIVSKAEEKAKAHLQSMRQAVATEIASERKKIPQVTRDIAGRLYEQLVN